MGLGEQVRRVLDCYDSECPGVKTNLARMLMHGRLAGSGKLLILPVDQGLEHGPVKSFDVNPAACDPHYHFQLAIDCGFSAFAAPIGMLECGAAKFAGQVPLILKLNSSTALTPKGCEPTQAMTSSVYDALRLGCVAVGITIYPGSGAFLAALQDIKEHIRVAKQHGLAVVVWSYPRGGDLSPQGETSIDIVAYAAHIAASIGANIIKVKLPSGLIEKDKISGTVDTLAERVAFVKRACFDGRRMVVFSGGSSKDDGALLEEITAVKLGGGDGSIIGRNSFQRTRDAAISLVERLVQIYK